MDDKISTHEWKLHYPLEEKYNQFKHLHEIKQIHKKQNSTRCYRGHIEHSISNFETEIADVLQSNSAKFYFNVDEVDA